MATELLVSTDWLAEHLGDPNVRVVDIRGYVVTKPVAPGVEQAELSRRPRGIPGGPHPRRGLHRLDDRHHRPRRSGSRADRAAGAVRRGDGRARDRRPDPRDRRRSRRRPVRDPAVVGLVLLRPRRGQRARRRLESRGSAKGARSKSGEVDRRPRSYSRPRSGPSCASPPSKWRRLLGPSRSRRQLVDARDPGQYSGARRRGPRGGHIPGAINVPRELFFAPQGGFLPLDEIRRRVQEHGLCADRPTVAYCNGGVAATVVLFNLARLGYADLANYDGSWNEWGTGSICRSSRDRPRSPREP